MNLDAAIETFQLEAKELLEEMEEALLSLDKIENPTEAVNSAFRAIHTIKGSSGMFGFNNTVSFTHVVENLLEKLRQNDLKITKSMINELLASHDYVKKIIEYDLSNPNTEVSSDLKSEGDEILSKLNAAFGEVNIPTLQVQAKQEQASKSVQVSDSQLVKNDCWHISIRFLPDTFRSGFDPLPFISYLKKLGNIINLITIVDNIPDVEVLDPESCYLGFEIDLKADTTKNDILEVFEFVLDLSSIKILPPNSSITEYVELIANLPEENLRIGEILTEVGSLTKRELDLALSIQSGNTESPQSNKGDPIGEILINEKVVAKEVINAAIQKQKEKEKEKNPTSLENKARKFIRIEAEKLDLLVNLVGELVTTGSNVKNLAHSSGNNPLIEAIAGMSRLVEEIRESTMNVRMVQIGDTFKKFERVVYDLSKELGKEINFSYVGGDTELDKTVVEKISDPLVHLVRNSIDHGISGPEDRISKGKPREGNIKLTAYHDTGNIVVEIEDDGEGINTQVVRNKAIEKGLIDEKSELSDLEIHQLILEPGFSTKEIVTNVSGRGVGMDVVKRNIEMLRGTIEIDSTFSKGTKIRVHLPLTLVIIDGFLVTVKGNHFVVPLDMVLECIETEKEKMDIDTTSHVINLRGEVLPFIPLKEFFDIEENESSEERDLAENIIVVKNGRNKAGLVVNKLLGELQTVIKPLGKVFDRLTGISGATILGSGNVAFILDVPRLLNSIAINRETKEKETSLR